MRFYKIFFLCTATVLMSALWYSFSLLKPFPRPTGPFSVGTVSMDLNEFAHEESFAKDHSFRVLALHFYYPAEHTKGCRQRKVYLEREWPFVVRMISQRLHIPAWLLVKAGVSLKTFSYTEAPLSSAQKQYPLIIFSHGLFGAFAQTYAAILEEIASHGYIVISIDHSYLSALTLLADGRVISAVHDTIESLPLHEQYAFTARAIEIYKKDVLYVLDQLPVLNNNPSSIFYQRFDCNRIGLMGHSAGGTAALELSKIDDRIKAVVNLDGWYEHVISREMLPVAALLLLHGDIREKTDPIPEYLTHASNADDDLYSLSLKREKSINMHKKELCAQSIQCAIVTVPGALHADFSDFVLAKWPLRPFNAPDSYDTLKIINKNIFHFFDTYL